MCISLCRYELPSELLLHLHISNLQNKATWCNLLCPGRSTCQRYSQRLRHSQSILCDFTSSIFLICPFQRERVVLALQGPTHRPSEIQYGSDIGKPSNLYQLARLRHEAERLFDRSLIPFRHNSYLTQNFTAVGRQCYKFWVFLNGNLDLFQINANRKLKQHLSFNNVITRQTWIAVDDFEA
jgi:hypothetical protein